jgi:hypothetical protein
MAEKWRDIAGYDGVYQVSDLACIIHEGLSISRCVVKTGS